MECPNDMFDKKSNTMFTEGQTGILTRALFARGEHLMPNGKSNFPSFPEHKGTANTIILHNVEFRRKCDNGLEIFYSI